MSKDSQRAFTRQQELADLQLALERKRSEVSSLVTGYRRAVEGIGPIPAEPLRRNLMRARAELTALESRLSELQRRAASIGHEVTTRAGADMLS
jgi:hypothetical protein